MSHNIHFATHYQELPIVIPKTPLIAVTPLRAVKQATNNSIGQLFHSQTTIALHLSIAFSTAKPLLEPAPLEVFQMGIRVFSATTPFELSTADVFLQITTFHPTLLVLTISKLTNTSLKENPGFGVLFCSYL